MLPDLGFRKARHLVIATGLSQRLPRCTLHGPPRRALPTRAGGARGRVLHSRRVERRAPTPVIVLGQLQIVALAMHPHGHSPDAGPRVQPGTQRPESAVIRGQRKRGKSDCCPQELAAWVEDGLFDHLVDLAWYGRHGFPLQLQ